MTCSRSPSKINCKVKASTCGSSLLPSLAASLLPLLPHSPQEGEQPTKISLLSFASESVMCSAPTTVQSARRVTGKCSQRTGRGELPASENVAAVAAAVASPPIRELSSRRRKPGARGWGCGDLRLHRNSGTLMSLAVLLLRQLSQRACI